MGRRGFQRGPLAATLLIGILAWTSARVTAAELRAKARQSYWTGKLREALLQYGAARALDPFDLEALRGAREVYVSALESPPLLESELGVSFKVAGERCGQILVRLVETAPLLSETWVGVSDFYGALKPENQRKRAYTLEEVSTKAEENLEPEDLLEIRALATSTIVDPNGVFYWDTLGDLAWNLGLRDLALKSYHEAVLLDPDPNRHVFLSALNLNPELSHLAVEAMNESLGPRRRAEPETVYRNLGFFHLEAGQFREAAETFRKAAAVARESNNYVYLQAYAEANQGHQEIAIRLYRKALSQGGLGPEDRFRIHLNLGELLTKGGRHQEASQELRAALLLKPREPKALVLLGQVYEALELFPEAEEQYTRAAESSVERISPLVNLVQFYRRTGRPGQALEPARKLAHLQPGEEAYRKQLEEIEEEIDRAGH